MAYQGVKETCAPFSPAGTSSPEGLWCAWCHRAKSIRRVEQELLELLERGLQGLETDGSASSLPLLPSLLVPHIGRKPAGRGSGEMQFADPRPGLTEQSTKQWAWSWEMINKYPAHTDFVACLPCSPTPSFWCLLCPFKNPLEPTFLPSTPCSNTMYHPPFPQPTWDCSHPSYREKRIWLYDWSNWD